MKINTKSNRGVTITGLVIYVSSFLMICAVIGVITTFFYNNTKVLSSEATAYAEYDILNAYLAKEAKTEGNKPTILNGGNGIKFDKGNQYIFNNDASAIYLVNNTSVPNKYFVVAEYVKKGENPIFQINGNEVTLNIKILKKDYTQKYNLAD